MKMKGLKAKSSIFILMLVFVFAFTACSSAPTKEPVSSDANAIAVEETQKTDMVEEAVVSYFADVPSNKNMIDAKGFLEKVKNNENLFILDIRNTDAYEKGHIKGAVNVPFGAGLSKALDKLPKDQLIMINDDTGQKGNQLVFLLKIAGYNTMQVRLGWDLGISKESNVKDFIETKSNDFLETNPLEIQPEIKDALVAYFISLEDVKGTVDSDYIISEADAKKIVDAKDSSVLFLDLKKTSDYNEGHIENAINIVYKTGKNNNDAFFTLPKDKKIIPLWYIGAGAGQVAAGLRLLGYDAVSLNFGMGTPLTGTGGWNNQNLPVVK